MARHVTNHRVFILSLLNLAVAILSIALHFPNDFRSSRSENSQAIASFPVRLLNISQSTISFLGFVTAALNLVLLLPCSPFYGTPLFWSTVLLSVGWAIQMKKDILDWNHLILALSLLMLIIYSMFANIRQTTESSEKLPLENKEVPPKQSKGIPNPGFGLNDFNRVPTSPPKSPRRLTIAAMDSSKSSDVSGSSLPLGNKSSGYPDLDRRSVLVSPKKTNDYYHISSHRRSSSSGPSRIFKSLPISIQSNRPSNLASLIEDVSLTDHGTPSTPSTSRKTLRRISGDFRRLFMCPLHMIHSSTCGCSGAEEKPKHILERIGLFLGGLILSAGMWMALAALVVAVDSLYPMWLVTDFARVFRRNFRTLWSVVAEW